MHIAQSHSNRATFQENELAIVGVAAPAPVAMEQESDGVSELIRAYGL
jgi:hypothetical protein